MITWAQLVALAILQLGLLSGAFAAPCGPYRVAFYEFGSLYFKNESGEASGIDKDVIDELARRKVCRFDSFLDSRARTWSNLEAGVLDMSVSGIVTPEREKFAEFVPYIKSRNILLVHSSLAPSFKSMDAFVKDSKLRLGVVRGFKHGTQLDAVIADLRQQGRVDDYADAETVTRIFALGKMDGLMTQWLVWGPLAKKNQLEGKVRFLPDASTDVFAAGLVLSRTRVSEADRLVLRKGIEAMRADGTLLKIFNRYLPADVAASVLL